MIHPLIQAAEAGSTKDEPLPPFGVGDDVDVFYKIIEGKKERVQRFTGTVIQIKGRGTTKTFTVRRLVAGQGVERIFPYHSPNVSDVKVKRSGRIRRARLYYLRDRVGKATRLAEKKDGRVSKKQGAGSGGGAVATGKKKGAQKSEQADNKVATMAEAPEIENATTAK